MMQVVITINNDRSPSGSFCDFEWVRNIWNVTTTSCLGLENKVAFAGKIKLTPIFANFLFSGDYDNHECSIRVSRAEKQDTGLWTCELEYYKFGGGRGSSKVLSKDTYVHVMSPTTPTTTLSTTPLPTSSVQSRNKVVPDVAMKSSEDLLNVNLAKFVPIAISILVIVIFVVLFTLIVVLHKLKNVGGFQPRPQSRSNQGQSEAEVARTRLEAELDKLPGVEDVMFLKKVFPHVMRLNSTELGLNL